MSIDTIGRILLQKLRWFRPGNEIAERQWRDSLGIVAVQAGHLDAAYLREHAGSPGACDLLERALETRNT